MAALDRVRPLPAPLLPPAPVRKRHPRAVGLTVVWAVVLVNAVAIVWLWVHGGNWTRTSSGEVLTSIARLTGLLGAYLALLQVAKRV